MGIKAIFILLGPSNLSCCQDPISLDKLPEMLVALVNCILILTLDLCRLTLNIPPDFLAEVSTMLCMTWGLHWHTFTIHEVEELTGKLNHIGFDALGLGSS